MKRIILTGATGFVGANLTRRLLTEGHEVHLLLRKDYKPWRIDSIKKEIQIHIVDLNDAEALDRVLSEIKADWVFHLAAYGAYSSQTDFRRMAETNLMATANFVDSCIKIGFEVFINTGSSSEYGYKDHAPNEKEWLEPNSSYAVLKAAATQYCRFVAQSKQVNLATLRLYSVYGPYEEPSRLMPTLIIEGLQGRLPPLVNPEIARDYIFIDDVSEAFLKAASNPSLLMGKVYNIGSGIQVSLKKVVEIARKELPIKAEPAWGSMPNRGWDTTTWVANINNAVHDLGWQPHFSLTEGFKQFTEWMIFDQFWYSFYKTNHHLPD
jgi:UDP-glucose 4-epimerase